ncbi:hypothetical protein KI387_000260, partial [Taxus chinensis]
VVNNIRGLGEEVKEEVVVQKVLRSLTPKFDPKVSTIEEVKDLKVMLMDELHGILTAYEMSIVDSEPIKKEIDFKTDMKTKEYKTKDNSVAPKIDDDELFASIARKLKVGSGKYK